MRMPCFKSQQIDSLFHFLRFVHLLLTLRDKRCYRAVAFPYTWTEPGGNSWNKQGEEKRLTATEYIPVFSHHISTQLPGGSVLSFSFIIITFVKGKVCFLFLNPQDEVGPSISSSVVLCSFVLSVSLVVLVLVFSLCPSCVRVHSHSLQRTTISQGQYQGSPAIWGIVSSDGGKTT
jgi:hypothetical protein